MKVYVMKPLYNHLPKGERPDPIPNSVTVDGHEYPVVKWESICHVHGMYRTRALIVDYLSFVDRSRWTSTPRKRPFIVRDTCNFTVLASSKTLEGALRLAHRLGREMDALRARMSVPTVQEVA